jgi:hypothetical protein
MGKRKYPKIKEGYWVYSIKIPSVNKYYIGVSKRKECWQRWQKSAYKGTALENYFSEWQNMEKTVLIDGLTKQDAFIYEGKIIEALKMNDLCINSNRSGLIEVSDANVYMREYREDNTELRENHKQLCKQWRENNKEKCQQYRENNREYQREYQKQYRLNNKEKMREYDRQRRLKKKLEKQQQHTVVH